MIVVVIICALVKQADTVFSLFVCAYVSSQNR